MMIAVEVHTAVVVTSSASSSGTFFFRRANAVHTLHLEDLVLVLFPVPPVSLKILFFVFIVSSLSIILEVVLVCMKYSIHI